MPSVRLSLLAAAAILVLESPEIGKDFTTDHGRPYGTPGQAGTGDADDSDKRGSSSGAEKF